MVKFSSKSCFLCLIPHGLCHYVSGASCGDGVFLLTVLVSLFNPASHPSSGHRFAPRPNPPYWECRRGSPHISGFEE